MRSINLNEADKLTSVARIEEDKELDGAIGGDEAEGDDDITDVSDVETPGDLN